MRTFKVQRTYKIELPEQDTEAYKQLVAAFRASNDDSDFFNHPENDTPDRIEDELLAWLSYECDAGNYTQYVEERDYDSWQE